MNNEEYLNDPRCPDCGSHVYDMPFEQSQIYDNDLHVPCKCLRCQTEWWETYTLTGYFKQED
jgi:predicted Zn-ribbon and HTH transcriptional regulator